MRDMERRYDVYELSHELLVKVGGTAKAKVPDAIRRYLDGLGQEQAGLRVKPAMAAIS